MPLCAWCFAADIGCASDFHPFHNLRRANAAGLGVSAQDEFRTDGFDYEPGWKQAIAGDGSDALAHSHFLSTDSDHDGITRIRNGSSQRVLSSLQRARGWLDHQGKPPSKANLAPTQVSNIPMEDRAACIMETDGPILNQGT